MPGVPLLLLLLSALSVATSAWGITVSDQCDSASGSVFDPGTLSCLSVCPSAAPRALLPSPSGFPSCLACRTGLWSANCTPCANSSTVPSSDQSSCVACPFSVDPLVSECVCPAGSLLVDRDLDGRLLATKLCLNCSAGTFPSKQAGRCVQCPDASMVVSNGTCACRAGTALIGARRCVSSTRVRAPLTSAADTKVTFRDVREGDEKAKSASASVDMQSGTMAEYLDRAAKGCELLETFEDGGQACQALGNLCVLQNFDDASSACSTFKTIAASKKQSKGIVNGMSEWVSGMPWLLYGDTSATASKNASLITTKFAFSNSSGPMLLDLYVASYSANGTWRGFGRLEHLFSTLCSDGRSMPAIRFGRNVRFECDIDLRRLVSFDTVFHDLYVLDGTVLRPSPVRSMSMIKGGLLINQQPKSEELTRRFFVVDAFSGKATSTATIPDILRFPTVVELRTTLHAVQAGSTGNIFPPLLKIQYSDRRTASIAAGKFKATVRTLYSSTNQLRLRVSFVDDARWWHALQYALYIGCAAVGIVLWMRRMVVWVRKNHTHQASFLLYLIVCAADSLADVVFWALFVISLYSLVFFRGQSNVAILLPDHPSRELTAFAVVLAVCLGFKALRLLFVLYKQCTADVFFVDWEKPRGKLMPKGNEKPQNAPVSVWRSLFAVNEWNELQCVRMVSREIVIVVVAFVFYGTGAINLARSEPASWAPEGGSCPLHPVLLFAVCSITWVICVALQALLYFVLRFRWSKDEVGNFIDLLSVSNLSCLALDDACHGYYIHGRSVHAFSDTSMAGMNANLQSEQQRLTAARGLLPDSDVQLFEVFLTPKLAADLRQLYFFLIHQERTGGPAAASGVLNLDSAARALKWREQAPAENLVKAYKAFNAFLRGLIERTDKEHEYTVVTKPEQKTSAHRYLRVPPDVSLGSQSFFFGETNTRGLSGSLFLMGAEYDLMLFGVLLSTLISLLSLNPMAGLFASFAVEWAFVRLRSTLGSKNVGFKTLTDKRFLL